MLPLVVLLCSFALTHSLDKVPWHQNGIIYQLYPRSFQDSDGDGIGDLKGVTQRIDYLESLGISAVWFSPIYPSPNEDYGYDISNFVDVSPEYGTLEDFDDLVAKLKKRGIRVLLDFVPNHSSTEHEWFKQSEIRNDTVEKYSNFYVWKDPKGYDQDKKPIPPNNWLGVIGTGSAWKWSEKRKQFYLHNFLDHQADLNYANPDVVRKMQDTLKFWMRRGVSGFRVDAVSWLYENQEYKDEPLSRNFNPNDPNNYDNLDHIYTMDLPETLGIVKDFRKTLDHYTDFVGDEDSVVILESYSPLETLLSYYGNKNEPAATFPFNFIALFLNQEDNSTVWETQIKEYYKSIGNRPTNWVLGNHDQHRVASRWSEEWVDVLHILMMTLKGAAVTYNGEELGLEDSTVRWDQALDIQGIAAGKKRFKERSRDFERGPMPWDSSRFAGFTNGTKPWVPLAPSYWKKNVKAEETAERSHLKVYKALAKLRKGLTLTYGDLKVKASDNQLLYIIRSLKYNPSIISVVNIGDRPVTGDLHSIVEGLPKEMNLLISSINFPDYTKKTLETSSVHLPPKSGVVLST